jgi:ubiquinol-cytochrome c reductase iron-sulfur subunit
MSDVLNTLPNLTRRQLLFATAAAGGVAAVATVVPFVSSLSPSERALAAGGPVEADIFSLAPGELMTVEWRGKPVWIVHRTAEMIDSLKKNESMLLDPQSTTKQQPDYARNELRSIKPEIFVGVGICTHLGCSPSKKFEVGNAAGLGSDWPGGFFCPCHGSKFDVAGRVFKGVPAPTNLEIPPHTYISEARVLIGKDGASA